MIPLKLTIQGLYSYQQAQVIDFSRLMEAQLFGIFGGVGSGKSSILEAISIAVYNETERMHQRDNKTYNMMNLKSDTLLIDFEFQNFEGKIYRAKVEGKRKKNKFEEVPPFTRSLYCKDGNEWIPTDQKGDEIVGLSYDNFRRTIIIPQGKFQEFLQLGDKDRTKMMEELFQLHRFDFSHKTTLLEAKNKESLNQVKGQFELYKDLNDEMLSELRKKVAEYKSEYEQIKKQVQESTTKVNEAKQLQVLFTKLKLKKTAFEDLQTKQPEIEKLEQEMMRYEAAVNTFQNLLESFNRERLQLQDIGKRKQGIQNEIVKLQQALQALNAEKLELQDAYNSIQSRQEQIRVMHNIAKAKLLEAEIKPIEAKLQGAQGDLQKLKSDVELKSLEIESLKQKIKSTKVAMPDYSVIAAVNLWWSTFDNLTKQVVQERSILEAQTLKLKNFPAETQQQAVRIIGKHIFEEIDENELEHFLHEVARVEAEERNQLEKLTETLKKYELKQKLAGMAGTLKPGESCPVCGAVEHPHILVTEDISRDLHAQKNAIHEKEKFIKKLLEANGHLKAAIKNYNSLKTEQQSKKQNFEELNRQLNAHKDAFKFDGYSADDRKKSATDAAKYDDLKMQVRSLEVDLEKMETEIANSRTKFEKLSKQQLQWEQEIREKKAKAAALTEEAGQNVLSKYADMQAGEVQGLADAETAKIETVKKQYEDAVSNINLAEQALAGKSATAISMEEQMAALQASSARLEQNIHEKLEESEFNDLAEVETLLNSNPDFKKQKQRVEDFKALFLRTSAELEMLEQDAGGKTFDEDEFEILKEELAKLEQKERAVLSELSKTEQEALQLDKSLKAKAELSEKLKKLETRDANIKTLKGLFKAKGFVHFVSGGYLQQLCQAANDRFHKLTRQQLSLELNDKLNFIVRDYLHNGRTRSVKTLSGGQTFQASLSLALALAGSIRQQFKADQNFFFLDEGFGALDKDSLQTVFHTLKSLRDERRIVGLISHVEELQQEIDVFLRIVNDPETGSRVLE